MGLYNEDNVLKKLKSLKGNKDHITRDFLSNIAKRTFYNMKLISSWPKTDHILVPIQGSLQSE